LRARARAARYAAPPARFSLTPNPALSLPQGANSLVGRVAPVPGRGLEAPAPFQIFFYKGGCGTFLRVLFHFLGTYREMDEVARAAFFAPQNMQAQMPTFQAFVDPSDPSRLFLSQPPGVAPPPQQPRGGGGGGPPPPPGYAYS
jgi:hypothetical protein